MIARGACAVTLLAMLIIATAARGQIAAGGATAENEAQAHAWAVTPSTTSSDWGLWHIPPRTGDVPAADGSVRIVDSLRRKPEAMAAFGGRVWMAFAGGGNRPGYTFLTAAVRPGAIDGTWFTGAGGRLASTAYLETKGRVLGLAAGPRGPAALVEELDGSWAIAWLERGAWHWASGPGEDTVQRSAAIGVLEGEIGIATLQDSTLTLWRASLPEQADESSEFQLLDPGVLLEAASAGDAAEPQWAELDWRSSTATLPEALRGVRTAGALAQVGSRSVLSARGEAVLYALEVDAQDVRIVYQTEPGAMALLPQARRGIVVRVGETTASAEDRAATRLVLEEFSLDTGRRFFVGPAVFDGPVSPSDLRILLVLMVLVSASLLLFVVRTSTEAKPYVAPTGLMLAPPIPRLLAGMADGFLALLLGGELARLLPPGWLAIRIGADALDFAPLILGLAIGLFGCAVLEAITGRTLGKIIFGLAVSRPGEIEGRPVGPRRPSLGQSLTRNAVKWLLPLVAVAGLFSPALRHRGDTMTGLGVVGAFPGMPQSTQPDPESDQDRGVDDR